MEPLKIRITGDFWDSFAYSGKLYLWDTNNDLTVVDWERFMANLFETHQNVALLYAFQRGDLLYGEIKTLAFKDKDFVSLLKTKFAALESKRFEFSLADLAKYITARRSSPFRSPCTDLDIYNNAILGLTDDGLHRATVGRNLKYFVSTRPRKLSDLSGYSVRIKSNSIAISAGDEGLFEYSMREDSIPIWRADNSRPHVEFESRLRRILASNSISANWCFASILSTDAEGHSVLAAFDWERDHPHELKRVFVRNIDEREFFPTKGRENSQTYSWGLDEKLYKTDGNELLTTIFTQGNVRKEEPAFNPIASEIRRSTSNPVAGGVAVFGTILESDERLTVIRSDGETFTMSEPPTRWRVFPRSKRYENQLHIVLSDRLEIVSFNHDFFVNQDQKTYGTRFRDGA